MERLLPLYVGEEHLKSPIPDNGQLVLRQERNLLSNLEAESFNTLKAYG